MSNTGIVGISWDIHQNRCRIQVSHKIMGKLFYRSLYSKKPDLVLDLELLDRAKEILEDFKSAVPCSACGNIVLNVIDGECVDCRNN